MRIRPKIQILPEAQQELWPFLKEVPGDFVLYGGTAVALRYGHRISVDFDFFSSKYDNDVQKTTDLLSFVQKFAIDKEQLSVESGSQVIYTLEMSNKNTVEITFVRDNKWIGGSIKPPDSTLDNKIKIASSLDLMATKINALKNRESVKDFVDISVMIENNVSLSRGFAGAMALQKESLPRNIEFYKFLCEELSNPEYIETAFKKDEDAPDNLKKELPNVIKVIAKEAQKLSMEKMLKTTIRTEKDLSPDGRER